LWGIGHTVTIMVVGGDHHLRPGIPPRLGLAMGSVAVMLILLASPACSASRRG
jgi:hypothetical protein